MPSNLRLQMDSRSTQSFYSQNTAQSALKARMSLTQTYRIASTARGKLGREASRSDHDLRLLVGHANLLDTLMVELAGAEREQEAWFNDSVRTNNRGESPKHIQWFDRIAEEADMADDDSASDSDSDVDADDFPTRRRSTSPPPTVRTPQYEDEDVEVDDEDDSGLTLTRVPSHTPELTHDCYDSDSEDESMPPSPLHMATSYGSKPHAHVEATEFFPPPSPRLTKSLAVHEMSGIHSAPMVSAY